MSERPWTPGPWQVSCVSDGTRRRSVWTDKGPPAHIADVTNGEANARLISAAPDLYEALERFVTFHSGHVLPHELHKPMDDARAALAKARGET